MGENRPFDVLDGALNKAVIIRLKGGTELRGVMSAYDVHMNLVLQDAEQLENGELKRKLGTKIVVLFRLEPREYITKQAREVVFCPLPRVKERQQQPLNLRHHFFIPKN